jgi:hypothetical protein
MQRQGSRVIRQLRGPHQKLVDTPAGSEIYPSSVALFPSTPDHSPPGRRSLLRGRCGSLPTRRRCIAGHECCSHRIEACTFTGGRHQG